MAKIDKPEIGAELYSVFWHLYSSKLAPHRALKEYCVCKGTVRGFYTGSYTDVCMLFQGPNGTPTLSYYKRSRFPRGWEKELEDLDERSI